MLISIALEPVKKGDQSIGHSKGGLSTKIHATVDALGKTPRLYPQAQARAHDLQGAEVLLAQIAADTLAFDAHERVVDRLKRNGKSAVIPSKSNRKTKRLYDRELYKA